MARLSYVAAVVVTFSATALNAQDQSGAEGSESAAGAELYVDGDGENPWPEMTAPRKVKRVRRAVDRPDPQPDDPYPDEEPYEIIEDYEVPLITPGGPDFREPPGMLVVSDQLPTEAAVYDSTKVQRGGGYYSLNGSAVSISQAPWQAQLYFPRHRMTWKLYEKTFKKYLNNNVPEWALEHYCGGAVIAPQWILTAAHCLSQSEVKHGYRIRVGHDDLVRGGGQSFAIKRVVPYYGFVNKTGTDMALIEIEGRTNRPTIQLYNDVDPKAPRGITVYGWGRTQEWGDSNASKRLLSVDLHIMNRQRCIPFGKKNGWTIGLDIVCAQSPPDTFRKTCRGDSGSPVVDSTSRRLLAVVGGGGPKCEKDKEPSFYIWINDSKRKWIEKVTGLSLL